MEPQPVPDGAPLDHPALLFNRELSWLDFNWRVFSQALDERTPLLERVTFLAITANNMDEFYRKRVGGLKRQIGARVRQLSPDGRLPTDQLEIARESARTMMTALDDVWTDTLLPRMAEEGIEIRSYDSLTEKQREKLDRHFLTQIFPILTPLAVDPGHPFPFISNLSLSLAFSLRHPTRETEHFARLKVPTARGRFLNVPGEPKHLIALEELIRHNASALFPGMVVEGVHAFRVTRNADVERNEEEADDLLSMISEELRERRFADIVRLEVESDMPKRARKLLTREMGLDKEDVLEVNGLIDLSGLFEMGKLDLPEHTYLPWEPVVPIRLRHREFEDEDDIFAAIREGDVLVHHPYESFAASTQRFIQEAADDPHVIAIKMTLYRTSQDSPIVQSLIRAAERGKQVAVLVELKARFDEENNIEWAQRLERAGAHVAYGLVGLKTHAKTALVVREERGDLRTYCHVGTGNYNPKTARVYTDFGLLTCREEIGADLIALFHHLTGLAPDQVYKTLHVAPRDLRGEFVRLIRREIDHQRLSGTGRIVAKMNALDDTGIIRELYRASRAGVQIDLIVRGHCRLRPGLPGYSENIRVVSIIGRFLEHSRIFYFHNDGDPDILIGSADWMRRNLDDRVEVIAEVEDEDAKARLSRTLKFCLEDNRLAWDLGPDGRYTQRQPAPGDPIRALHDTLMHRARRRTAENDRVWSLAG
ncbi:RNA degradosome polyphosphate kinase [Rubricoccus marinus]|uniref:Polyphosphate kinase n=1 Tax=Rubricoccus marinus TaxID=716817 RepID=A0A259U3N3_9BACT|nr:RNA degradosome polyphosphate kinase [Rubricoccus marinus]